MTARDGAARLPGMVSDADWAWVRFGEDQTTPRECVLIDGSYLLLHGQRVVATSERAGYIVACVAGDGTRIDTDARGPLKGELTQGHASPAIEWPHRVDRDKVAYVRD